jgi:hypothetical protein
MCASAPTFGVVYITRGLLTALLEFAEDRDPASVTVSLAATPSEDLDVNLPSGTPVLTDMYLPEAGESVTAVFGMDLSTPDADGRFLSHPEGHLTLTTTDDLHRVVLVAVPPYDEDCVAAFDRAGDEQPLEIVDIEPPEGRLEDYSR